MRSIFASITAAIPLICIDLPAHAAGRAPAYRVEEIRPPAERFAPCLAGYRNFASAAINDFGVVAGNYSCYSQFDTTNGATTMAGGPFVWASWFGGLALNDADPSNCCSFATSINNRGEVFGSDVGASFTGVRWSLAGGFETIFPNDPRCDIIELDIAIAGNGRYAVATGFRPDPALPIEGLCLLPTWITRTPAGTLVEGPQNTQARDLNAFNVGVGVMQYNTAIRYNVVNGELRILHSGDATHQAWTTDINDLGEVSGYLDVVDENPQPGACSPLSSVALRWNRNDQETVLPHLPGATSSRAWNVGYDGETVGQSGPGELCEPQNATNERAVLWRGGRPLDLNTTIPAHLGVTLAAATSINRRGQIVAFGYRNDDPLVICPKVTWDPETLQNVVDLSQRCRYQRLFVLTPR